MSLFVSSLLRGFSSSLLCPPSLYYHFQQTINNHARNDAAFAHGPGELRVKANRAAKWGLLFDEETGQALPGVNLAATASGGEDTYGSARKIERTRLEDGKDEVRRHGGGRGGRRNKKEGAP